MVAILAMLPETFEQNFIPQGVSISIGPRVSEEMFENADRCTPQSSWYTITGAFGLSELQWHNFTIKGLQLLKVYCNKDHYGTQQRYFSK